MTRMIQRGHLLSETFHSDVAIRDCSYDERMVLSEHLHPCAYVSFLVEGEYTELRAGLPRRCRVGTAIFHPPGEAHADVFVTRGRCLNFETMHGGLSGARESILAAARETHPALASAITGALDAAIISETAYAAPDWIERICRQFPWAEPVPLESAARLAGLHRTHFIRAFSRHVGVTPVRYRRRERVRAASALLLDSPTPLSRIAHECGFFDQSHLTNVFREETGMTPLSYRRAFTS